LLSIVHFKDQFHEPMDVILS